jgi:hypothetical protein
MPKGKSKVQGEGDYESARRFNKASREFVETHDTGKLGRQARPRSEQEAKAMNKAEEKGKSRAKR